MEWYLIQLISAGQRMATVLAAAGAGPATEDRAQTGIWGALPLLSAGLALPAAAKSRNPGLR